jgi:hypothetical protein
VATTMNTVGPFFVYIIITTYIFWMLSGLFTWCEVFSLRLYVHNLL